MTEKASPKDVLDFWFGAPDDPEFGQPREAWFKKDDAFDADIRSKFGAAVEAAIDGGLEDWEDCGDGSLALILLLDQYARNIFRGSNKSFAGDVRTRRVAAAAIEAGIEKTLNIPQRVFLYLPFEHSESIEDQRRSMELFNSLPDYEGRDNQIDYAQRHFDRVIVKTGVWAFSSSGDLISLSDFDTVSEFDSCNDFPKAVEAA